MIYRKSLRAHLCAAAVGLVFVRAAAASPPLVEPEAASPAQPKAELIEQAPLTPEQEASYGGRADFFRTVPPPSRPDVDWRSVLSESLADVQPKWSQGFEELVIRDFFQDREGGFFVDVGCSLPKKSSTTYDLEKRLDWTGIGIDVMKRYENGWKKYRPRSKFVQAAISDKDGETLEMHVAGPIVTVNKDIIEGFGFGELSKTIQVETSTLDTLLDQRGVEKIDFLSMDIEGAELLALRGFDIKRFNPDLCCVETAQHEAVIGYFEANGYELIEKYKKVDKINLYFRPRQGE